MAKLSSGPSGPRPAIAYRPAFAAGIISPMLRFRSDMEKWQTGACQLTNFFVHVQGGASNRPGTQYIGAVKDAANLPRLVPFVYNNTQSYVLEMGNEYIRFISDGAYLTNTDGSVYEVATPYAVADVWGIRWVQSADVLTISHPSYPLYNLSRSGETDWTLSEVSFAAGMDAPGTVSATATNGNAGNTGTTPGISSATYDYVVTAVSIALSSESNVSAVVTVKNYNIGYYTQYGNYNTVNWSEVSGADYYNIYRKYAGSYGLIGSTTDLTFQDTDYEPDTAIGPPTHEDPFSSGNNPSCVSYFQQRRVFGGSTADPQTIWMTRSGNYTNMDVANPVKDDDAITATIASQQVNQIKHVVPMADLIIFTAGSVWKVSGGDAGKAITPADVTVTPQMFVGAADTLPLPIDQDVLFVESKGSHVRDLQYDYYAAVYNGTDLSVLADHLFYGYTINDWRFAQFPFNIVWAVRSDGTLLGLTYLKEQQIWAWHQHTTTNGKFTAVTVVPEETENGVVEDTAYFVVERTINGQTVAYVERLHTRQLGTGNSDITKAWFVDAGLQYAGTAVNTVSGLSHLEGQTVSACIDGKGYTGLTVTNGAVTLPVAGSTVTVGLPIAAHLQSLPLDLGQPPQFSRRKRVSKIYTMLYNTAGIEVSTDDGARTRPVGSAATSGTLSSDVQFVIPAANWDQYGKIDVFQNYPLPCTVTGLDVDVEVGN